MDNAVEMIDIGEGLMREEVTLQIGPGSLDVVEFGGIFRQPFDGQPIPRGEDGVRTLLIWMEPLSSNEDDGFAWAAGSRRGGPGRR